MISGKAYRETTFSDSAHKWRFLEYHKEEIYAKLSNFLLKDYMITTARIIKAKFNAKNINFTNGANFTVITCIPTTMWKWIELEINNTSVAPADNNHIFYVKLLTHELPKNYKYIIAIHFGYCWWQMGKKRLTDLKASASSDLYDSFDMSFIRLTSVKRLITIFLIRITRKISHLQNQQTTYYLKKNKRLTTVTVSFELQLKLIILTMPIFNSMTVSLEQCQSFLLVSK